MKRLPAFLLSACLAVSFILPASALDLFSEDEYPLIMVSSSDGDVSFLMDFDPDSPMPLADVSDCYIAAYQSTTAYYSDLSLSSVSSWLGTGNDLIIGNTKLSNTSYGFIYLIIPATGGDFVYLRYIHPATHNAITSINSDWSRYTFTGNSGAVTTQTVKTFDLLGMFGTGQSALKTASVLSSKISWADTYTFSIPDTFLGDHIALRFSYTAFTAGCYGIAFGRDYYMDGGEVPPGWIGQLPAYALESTLQSLLGVSQNLNLESTQKSILTRLNSISGSGGSLSDIVGALNNVAKDSTLKSVQSGISDVNKSVQGVTNAVNGFKDTWVNDPMNQFEDNYLDKFDSQIQKAEDLLSSSNSALPNGGDVGGFFNDIQDGLGLSGSSFSASDFNAATGSFSGSDSTSSGGPWEFFTQVVADDLAGDSSGASLYGLDPSDFPDDQFIYEWLAMMESRWGG